MQLNKAYIKDDFKDFLSGFLPDDLSLNEKELVIGDNYKNIKSGLVLGESKSLGVKVFYLEHEKEKDPRIALTTEAFKILSENWAKKALVVFNSKNSENWRLSLMTISFDINEKNKIVSNLSNPKRKSFFLGPNAKIATANQFLFSKGKINDFKDLESRFDVEVVTKEFFNKYKKLYIKLLDYLKNDKAFNVFAVKHGLELEIFSKKLLGQIVFIYFLQKKGWLGAKKGDNISSGDKIFLRNLFEKCKQEKKNFFNDYLESLFYDCLNRIPERAGSFYREKFDCQIPFLNGGLFEPINDYKWQNEFINIPNDIFSNNENSGILDVFDLYNFTIDENTPDDQEISVDPEMLGKVFENLLESNTRKGQGAFYTPREIVHYMCRESLVNYLATNHPNLSERKIRDYINYGDSLSKSIEELGKNWKGESWIPGQFNELNELLRNIKVVDPACGSGAFLVGMLQEIVRLRTFLQLTPDSESCSPFKNSIKELSAYDLKKETIQNCLYGVDIDPGAIDIAKLRFWLSIVVEENIEDIEPLPNLDYKIMQGNSLLEDLVIGDSVIPLKFEGKKKIDGRTKEMKDLFNESHQAKLFIDESEALVNKLEKYHTEYFNITDPEKKKILKKKIDGVEDELIQSKCNEEIEQADSFIKNNPNDGKKILKYTEKVLAIKEVLKKWNTDRLRPFFPWKLHFGEVFNRENGGFDIVIGNPPYIQLQCNGGELANKYELAKFQSFARTGDIYALFYEFGNKILGNNGTLTFITSNKWMRAGYGEKLRNYLAENTTPKLLIDLGPGVFETATVDTNILLFKKGKINDICIACSVKNNLNKTGISLKEYVLKNKIDLNNFTDDAWIILGKIEQNIKDKIEKVGIPLKDWDIKINRGILTGYNEAFIIDGKKKDELISKDPKSAEIIKPILRGRDIKRYGAVFADLWLISTHNGYKKENGEKVDAIDIEDYPAVKEWLDNYWKQISKRQDKGRTPYNLRNCAYQGEFEKEKIIWQEMVQEGNFLFDDKNLFCNDTGRIMTGNNLNFLLPILNSKIFFFSIKYFYGGGSLGASGVRMKHTFFENFSIPQISSEKQRPFIEKANKILEITGSDDYVDSPEKQAEVKEYEKQIDQLAYELYGLTKDEIKIVER